MVSFTTMSPDILELPFREILSERMLSSDVLPAPDAPIMNIVYPGSA